MAARSVSIFQQYIFILWDEGFEEEEALLFVTELREQGLRTKLLGFAVGNVPGRYGITLACDMALSEALPLVEQTVCVVIPGHAAFARILAAHPPLACFLRAVHSHGARLITNRAVATAETYAALPGLEDAIEICPGLAELPSYAMRLAQSIHAHAGAPPAMRMPG